MSATSLSRPSPVTIILLVASLALAYMVSMFLRSSVGLIAPELQAELHISASDLGWVASSYFLTFALMQLPLGVAMDRYGRKVSMLVCVGFAIGATVWFAYATSLLGLVGSRAVMGIGCSAFFMVPLAIYAAWFPPHRFAAMTGLQSAMGNLGLLASTVPFALVAAWVGWRNGFLLVAGLTVAIAMMVVFFVHDEPPHAPVKVKPEETLAEAFINIGKALKMPSVMPVFVMQWVGYSIFATVFGLWIGPYMTDVYGHSLQDRGADLLIMGVGQVTGLFAWGFADRLFKGSHKKPVLIANSLVMGLLFILVITALPLGVFKLWLFAFGFCAGSNPALIAHGRSLFPAHMVGRGLTLMNMGTIGGTFFTQAFTGYIIQLSTSPGAPRPLIAYQLAFLGLVVFQAVCMVVYTRSTEHRAISAAPANKA